MMSQVLVLYIVQPLTAHTTGFHYAFVGGSASQPWGSARVSSVWHGP